MSGRWSDEPLRDEEFPDEADADDGDGVDTMACPACGEEMAEDSPRCPHCGEWVTEDGRRTVSGGAKWFVKALVAAVLIAVILVAWHGLGR